MYQSIITFKYCTKHLGITVIPDTDKVLESNNTTN